MLKGYLSIVSSPIVGLYGIAWTFGLQINAVGSAARLTTLQAIYNQYFSLSTTRLLGSSIVCRQYQKYKWQIACLYTRRVSTHLSDIGPTICLLKQEITQQSNL